MVEPKFLDNICFIFGLLESILDEWKTIGYDQNFVLFPNMCSKILYLSLYESSERIFEHSGKLVWATNKQAFATPVNPFAKMLKSVEYGGFVERTMPYKKLCRTKMYLLHK